MAHFAITTPPLAGHVNALSALAGELIERGHRVTLLGPVDARARLADPRIGFRAIGADTHPPGRLAEDAARMGRLQGPFGVRAMIRDLAALTDMTARDGPDALAAIGADAVICDQLEPGGPVAALAAGLPYATVATGLHVNRDPHVPPPFVGWRHDATDRGAWKVRGAYRISNRMMAPQADALARWCRAYRLPERRDAADLLSPVCDLAQGLPSLDYPRASLPDGFRYVGPLRTRGHPPFPDLDRLDADRPLAFCSLGTIQGGRGRLLRRIGLACRDAGLSIVLVHCGGLTGDEERALAAELGPHAIVRDFVPQRAVLERASLAVLHGGFNTVLDALAVKVPLVVLPLAFEQPAIAARVERAGVGRRLTPQLATRGRLGRAITDVLADESMSASLERVAREAEAAGGAPRAATLIERALLRAVPLTGARRALTGAD